MKKLFLTIIGVFIVSLIIGSIYCLQNSTLIKLFPTTGLKTTIGITPQPDTSSPELLGKTFRAKENEAGECPPGPESPEGCWNPGYFTFTAKSGEEKVTYALPGSDIIHSATYKQSNNSLIITSKTGEQFQAYISEDGERLTETKTNTTYYLDKNNSQPEPTANPNDRMSRHPPLDDILTTDMRICDSDSDCVPEPTCHSEICINETYLGNYPDKSTLQCTEIFTPCEATPKSCLCQNGRCVNTRLDTPACMDYKEKIE